MARPKIDPNLRRINVMLAPPADLAPAMRKLWGEEFDRFPPGYFVPSDIRGMLLYLETVQRYRRHAAVVDKLPKPDKASAMLLLELAKMVHRLQRDLRMYPSTRTHREIHGSMANNPNGQSAGGPEEQGWRGLFDASKAPPARNPPPVAPAKRGRSRKAAE